jgi:hypothetical protein
MKRIIRYTVIIILVGIMIHQLISKVFAGNTETPEYTVVKKFDSVEIRHYPALVLASTQMGSGTYSENSGNGFRTVAGYIFGDNAAGEKISMTAPVMVEMDQPMQMSFIMPSAYSMEELPEPNNKQVYLHEASPKTLAVIRYGGFSNDDRFEEHKQKLIRVLEGADIKVTGEFMFFGYDPPYNLVNRRNEVAVEVILNE